MIRTIIEGDRRTGKTTELVKRIVKASKKDERSILVMSPMISMSHDLHRKVMEALPRKKVKRSISSPPAEINLTNGARIKFYTASPKATRGHYIDDLFVDEATFIDEEIRLATYPCATKTITETRLIEHA